MTTEEIIKLAGAEWQEKRGTMGEYLESVIKFAQKDEREKCANVIDKMMGDWRLGKEVAKAVRARGEK